MNQPTFSDGPPVPMMVEGSMNVAMLRQLLDDLQHHASILTIREKGSATEYSSGESTEIECVRDRLESGTALAVQIRYRYADAEWTDTILTTSDGFRTVRCRHDSSP